MMKKFGALLGMLGLLLTAGTTQGAITYRFFDDTDSAGASKGLLDMAETYDNPVDGATLESVTDIAGDPGAEFTTKFTIPSGGGAGFQQIQIGYKFWSPGGMPTGDISDYDIYSVTVKNVETEKMVYVNLFLNTGWTDPPYDMTDNYIQNSWTWIAPGETVTLSLDLTNLGLTDDNNTANGDYSGLDRRAWLTGIGMQYGSNVVASGAADDYQINSGDSLSIQVVPEPATVSLLAAGGLAMIIRKKRRI